MSETVTTSRATTRVSIPVPQTYTSTHHGSVHLEGMMRVFGNSASAPHIGLLILHPYSLLGGSMHDAVVMEVFRQAQVSRYFGSVIKYNMRGVGGSENGREGQGMASRVFRSLPRACTGVPYDVLDVSHVIDFLIESMERENPSVQGRATVALVGYSYGAAMAAHGAVHHPRVCQYVGISIPIGALASFFLKSKRYLVSLLSMSRDIPRLLVLGKQDQYTSEQQLVDCVKLVGSSSSSVSEKKNGGTSNTAHSSTNRIVVGRIQVDMYENNDHFWGNDCACMIEHVMSWLVHHTTATTAATAMNE